MTALAFFALVLAVFPALLYWRNLRAYQPPKVVRQAASEVAILIPARNEAGNIRAAIDAALTNVGAEVIVLDDLSTDETAAIVSLSAWTNPRVRLLHGRPLPDGWCGKNWACAQLAEATGRPLFLFVDADVRLAPEAAASVAAWLREQHADLASGVPQQELGSFSERLLLPLIHFVLLGFLPLPRMRASNHPAYATGCGQFVIADAQAYRKAGGHGAIRGKIHDGLALPRRFRERGLRTDLFDATSVATCRMYRSNAETWRGLIKNTHEGLGAPTRIVPATIILFAGQVLPFLLLFRAETLLQFFVLLGAAFFALSPRALGAIRFRQPLAYVILHPLAIAAILGIQWAGLVRFLLGKPTKWKARAYETGAAAAALTGDRVPATNAGQ